MTAPTLAPWDTSARATAFLVGRLPEEIWDERVPGVPSRRVRSIAAHLHNIRVRWLKQLRLDGVDIPLPVDARLVSRADLLEALGASAVAMRELFAGLEERGGVLPEFPWRNVPRDLEHFVAYHVAHEAHHRGQLVLVARQLGHRLPGEVTAGLWQWRRLADEA